MLMINFTLIKTTKSQNSSQKQIKIQISVKRSPPAECTGKGMFYPFLVGPNARSKFISFQTLRLRSVWAPKALKSDVFESNEGNTFSPFYHFIQFAIIDVHLIKLPFQLELIQSLVKHVLLFIFQMSTTKSKSPKKDAAPEFSADPEAKERARKALSERNKKKESIFQKYQYHGVIGIVAALILWAVITSVWKSGPDVETTIVNDPSYIADRNNAKLSFTVGSVEMFNDYKLVDAKRLINNQATNKQQLYRCNTGNKDTIIPESYNFRQAYPSCAREIIRQGNCSASYSIAAVSAINDRWCKSNEQNHPILSPHAPIACDKFINSHCKGGYVSRVLDYAKIYGLVDTACQSYNQTLESPEDCQIAINQCTKYKISDFCVASDAEGIRQQIFNYGPLIAVIPVYRDFLIYKNGVYRVYPKNQKFSSGHAVKIIGWREVEGQNCWLIENSWGTDWGQDGIGCILANVDQIQLEKFTIAVSLVTDESTAEEEAEKAEILDEQADVDHEDL